MLRHIEDERRWLVDLAKFQTVSKEGWYKSEMKHGWLMIEDSVVKPKTLSIRFEKTFYNHTDKTGYFQGYLRYTEGVDDKHRNEYDQKINQHYSKELLASADLRLIRTIYRWNVYPVDSNDRDTKPDPIEGAGKFWLSTYPDGLHILEAEPAFFSEITPPDFVSTEITGDKNYSNIAIARRLAL